MLTGILKVYDEMTGRAPSAVSSVDESERGVAMLKMQRIMRERYGKRPRKNEVDHSGNEHVHTVYSSR